MFLFEELKERNELMRERERSEHMKSLWAFREPINSLKIFLFILVHFQQIFTKISKKAEDTVDCIKDKIY